MNFNLLYETFYDALIRYAMTMTNSHAEAEDVVQETFLRAYQNRGLLENAGQNKAKNWLYKTARNLYIDKVRRKSKQPPPEEEPMEEDDFSYIFVQQALQEIPEELSHIVALRYFSGFNSTEIGEILGISPATVRTRLRAASKRLSKLYYDSL